jgi:uncharacterized protein HemX
MLITHFEAVMATLVAILTVLGIIATCLRWIYKQGGANTEQTLATRANTAATDKLSKSLDKFVEKTDGTITDHEKRITRLEDHEDTRGKQAKQP